MRTKTLIVFFAGLLLGALCRLATGQTVNVSANLVDGSNNPVPGAYLHFDLYNCGPNYPTVTTYTIPGVVTGSFQIGEIVEQGGATVTTATLLTISPFVVANLSSHSATGSGIWVGQSTGAILTPTGVPVAGGPVVVQRSFDLQQNSSGVISGTVIPNDLILCGNEISTQWTVTPMKSGATPLNAAQRYFICSLAGTGTPPCAQLIPGSTFYLSVAQPAQTIPQPPGYSLIYANPTATQSIVQPENTQFNWGGIVNFCQATVLCGGGSEGNLYDLEVNGAALSSGDTVNFNNSTPAAGSNGLNVVFQTSKSGSTDSVSAEIVGDGNAGHFLNGQGGFTAPSGGPTLQTNGTNNSSQSVLNLANGTNCTVTNTSGGTVTVNCPTGLPSSPQIGDTIRYNVNGDSAWDAVNATAKFVFIAVQNGSGIFDGGFGNGGAVTGVAGSLSATAPTANDNSGFTYSATASASTNTVIGVVQGAAANNGSWGFQAFYRWTHRFAIGNTTGCRYWTGLVEFVNGTYNTPVGTAVVATNTPNSPIVGFRYSAGTDSHWQAVSGTSSSTITVVDTGVTPDTNPHTFEVAWTGSAYVYLIDHTVVATISTNIPSASAVGTVMFWTGDNENAANACAGTIYHMMETLK